MSFWVPGAGVEPARNLAIPRDFKTHPLFTYHYLSHYRAENQRGSWAGDVPSLVLAVDGLGTITGTVCNPIIWGPSLFRKSSVRLTYDAMVG